MCRYLLWWSLFIMLLFATGCNLLPKPQPVLPSGQSRTGITVDGKPVGNMTASEVRQTVLQLAVARRREPVNAGFMTETEGFIPEQDGMSVDVETTVEAVFAAPANTALQAVINVQSPAITRQKLQNARLAGQGKTPLLDKADNRMHNILVAARNITNTIVMPGDVFSFNGIIGKTTSERGYLTAAVIENGKTTEGVGGGICQISSTLYNAALSGEFPVVERHAHSKPVNYVPEGFDATTTDEKDFKFRNNRRSPLILHILVATDAVRATIWELGS